jgi:spermidine/putrescine transport system permease protein
VNAAASRLARVVLGGYFGFMVLFLYLPLAVLVIFSFNDNNSPVLPLKGFTTRWYDAALNNDLLVSALKRSLGLAAVNGLAATLLAVMAALALSARRLVGRGVMIALIMLPLVVPYVVLGVGMLILLHQIGLKPSLTALLAMHVLISVPYGVLVILPRLNTLDASIGEAARDLGAGALSAFYRVTVPLILPAIISSFVIAFTISFDEVAIANFLVPPGHNTFPTYLYNNARTPYLRPQTVAIGGLIIAASLLLIVLSEAGRRRSERKLEGSPA